MSSPRRYLVAMSGGVDSSVAAALLVEQGHEVTGVTLKLWGGESDSGCCSVSDVEDARRVAAQLGIPHYVFNFETDFRTRVVDPYVHGYEHGQTPNPCVECNRSMKFGRLLDRALAMGFDALATGHHARIATDATGVRRLRRGADAAKDQSYVLYMLGPAELERAHFPVGDLTKSDVRAHAARLNLRTAHKPDSMDVCFIQRGERETFLAKRVEARPGQLVATDGSVVGNHQGVTAFTIGQRRGLGVALGERRYVVDIDAVNGNVTVGGRPDLLRNDVMLERATFSGAAPEPGEEVLVQVRAHGAPNPGRWRRDRVEWIQPQPRVAPGQVVALYRDDLLLGGAVATV